MIKLNVKQNEWAQKPKNIEILRERMALFDEIKGPRVGDFIETAEGDTRITYIWDVPGEPPQYQTGGNGGSYYLSRNGGLSYSGSLDMRGVLELKLIGQREAWVWFFDEGWSRAYGGVHYKVPMRLFKVVDDG